MRRPPSFFFVNSTGLPHGLTLGLMSHWLMLLQFVSSFLLTLEQKVYRLGPNFGLDPGSRSIFISTLLSGGNPGGNVSG